ncbi:MAG: hypothetical protein AAFZ18_01110 [Myxococcota bacterium]
MGGLLLLGLLASAEPAGAIVYLEGGGALSGPTESTETEVVVRIDGGELRVARSDVDRIEPSPTHPLAELRRRRARLGKGVQPLLKLARWASAQGLSAEAHQLWREVLSVDPQRAEARRAVGDVRIDGAWVSAEDARRQRGEVLYGGVWMSKEDAAERAREASAAVARAEAEAEARARARAAAAAPPPAPSPEPPGIYAPGFPAPGIFGVPWIFPGRSLFPVRAPLGNVALGLRVRAGAPGGQVIFPPLRPLPKPAARSPRARAAP